MRRERKRRQIKCMSVLSVAGSNDDDAKKRGRDAGGREEEQGSSSSMRRARDDDEERQGMRWKEEGTPLVSRMLISFLAKHVCLHSSIITTTTATVFQAIPLPFLRPFVCCRGGNDDERQDTAHHGTHSQSDAAGGRAAADTRCLTSLTSCASVIDVKRNPQGDSLGERERGKRAGGSGRLSLLQSLTRSLSLRQRMPPRLSRHGMRKTGISCGSSAATTIRMLLRLWTCCSHSFPAPHLPSSSSLILSREARDSQEEIVKSN